MTCILVIEDEDLIRESLEDLLSVEWSDIVVSGLEVNKSPFKAKKPSMAV